ncbi:hypothetical protein N7468_001993 [Penicillium chermesinum]|uniref:Uncharacterized protein n=1 Tax=Penicillium chermesinum TaxID=63820 RepID=A0A9W9PHL6_9EURO|nr:uncharacterized protein N7468_001993 [Penicillium chermesinum]KAJ5247010.1 hypothetical protein N7468_001993 [Penicillium chermesinum]
MTVYDRRCGSLLKSAARAGDNDGHRRYMPSAVTSTKYACEMNTPYQAIFIREHIVALEHDWGIMYRNLLKKRPPAGTSETTHESPGKTRPDLQRAPPMANKSTA